MANVVGRPIAALVLSTDERAYLKRQVRGNSPETNYDGGSIHQRSNSKQTSEPSSRAIMRSPSRIDGPNPQMTSSRPFAGTAVPDEPSTLFCPRAGAPAQKPKNAKHHRGFRKCGRAGSKKCLRQAEDTRRAAAGRPRLAAPDQVRWHRLIARKDGGSVRLWAGTTTD